MTQDYIKVDIDDNIKDTPKKLSNNFDAVLTSNSGAGDPAYAEEGSLWLQVGDISILNVYKNGVWVEVLDDKNTTKQNQHDRLDAISNTDAVTSSSFIPVYLSDSDVVFREASTNGLSILQSASVAGANFVNQSSLAASSVNKGIVQLANKHALPSSFSVFERTQGVHHKTAIVVGHLNIRTSESLVDIEENTEGSIPHGLSSTPKWVRLVAVCIGGSDYGYSIGDEVNVSPGSVAVWAADEVIGYKINTDVKIVTNPFVLKPPLTPVDIAEINLINLDTGSWKLKIYAGI